MVVVAAREQEQQGAVDPRRRPFAHSLAPVADALRKFDASHPRRAIGVYMAIQAANGKDDTAGLAAAISVHCGAGGLRRTFVGGEMAGVNACWFGVQDLLARRTHGALVGGVVNSRTRAANGRPSGEFSAFAVLRPHLDRGRPGAIRLARLARERIDWRTAEPEDLRIALASVMAAARAIAKNRPLAVITNAHSVDRMATEYEWWTSELNSDLAVLRSVPVCGALGEADAISQIWLAAQVLADPAPLGPAFLAERAPGAATPEIACVITQGLSFGLGALLLETA